MKGGASPDSIEGYKEAFSCMDKPFGRPSHECTNPLVGLLMHGQTLWYAFMHEQTLWYALFMGKPFGRPSHAWQNPLVGLLYVYKPFGRPSHA